MESKSNKSYRIRTKVGNELKTAKDNNLVVNFTQEYETFELLSIKMKTENLYKLHNANYGVVVGRVQANGGFGVPNAKISIFIEVDQDNENSEILAIYGYTDIFETNSLGDTYNLLPKEQVNDCHQKIGAFPSKRYLLDNDTYIEVFDKYYKYTTRTNNAGDYIIVGVPVGNQTLHMDLDLSDCGILSQRPRDFVYKGYTIEQFENPNQFKSATGASINFLSQYVQQSKTVYVNPLWGSNELGETLGITRADIDVNFKFEPTCVFMGSIVSDSKSNGISQKCVPTDQMGVMDELTTGRGTIEMIRKTPSGAVEEFQIKGNELIDGNGTWCYQIPMNLDYVTTNEYGETVATDNPKIGIPTRARVRFRMGLDNFEDSNDNYFVGKMLVPNNPQIYTDDTTGNKAIDYDYAFGTNTKDESYRDLFWNNVYSVKQHIPRIQKSGSWRTGRFTGVKQCNFYGQNNPIPYNSIRIKLPFMFVIMCAIIKTYVRIVSFLNAIINTFFRLLTAFIYAMLVMFTIIIYPIFLAISWILFLIAWLTGNQGMKETLVMIAKLDVKNWPFVKRIENISYVTIADGICPDLETWYFAPASLVRTSPYCPSETIFGNTYNLCEQTIRKIEGKEGVIEDKTSIDSTNTDSGLNEKICITKNTDYLMSCIEMNLAQEYKVIKFDFYNDWINGLLYIPRWKFRPAHKRTFLFGLIKFNIKEKGCFDDNTIFGKTRKWAQHCGLGYTSFNFGGGLVGYSKVGTTNGCSSVLKNSQKCHKNPGRIYTYIFGPNGGLVHKEKTMFGQTVYYYKPSELTLNIKQEQIKINIFATDLILLGSLNDCDEDGVPQAFKWLTSSSYKMPTNLALTNLDEAGVVFNDGSSYCNGHTTASQIETKKISEAPNTFSGQVQWSSTAPMEIQITGYGNNEGSVENIVNSVNDKIAITEAAGISWNYTGPQQLGRDNRDLFSPGGHFLGISCVSSGTNVKSCINLQRICEVGTTMSERIEKTRAIEKTADGKYKQQFYVFSPNGFISNDEVIAPSFRNMFATLNINPLIATRKDEKTGYLKYDFMYLRANGFDGGGKKNVVSKSERYNTQIDVNIETIPELDNTASNETFNSDADYDSKHTYHRAIESANLGYYRFRFGLRDSNPSVFSKEARMKYALEANGMMYLPQYENSFYFYFGLKDGNTALDKFYSDFYSMCPAKEITKSPKITIKKDEFSYCTRQQGVWISTENISMPYDVTITRKDGMAVSANAVQYKTVRVCGLLPGDWTVTVKENDGLTLNKKLKIGNDISSMTSPLFTDFKEDLGDFVEVPGGRPISISGTRNPEGGELSFAANTVRVFGKTIDEFKESIGNDDVRFLLVSKDSSLSPNYHALELKCGANSVLTYNTFNQNNYFNISTDANVTDFEFGSESVTTIGSTCVECTGSDAKFYLWGDYKYYTLYFTYPCKDDKGDNKYLALKLWDTFSYGYSIFNVYVGSKFIKYNGKNIEGFNIKDFFNGVNISNYASVISKINSLAIDKRVSQWAIRQALFDQRYTISGESTDRLIRCTNLAGEYVDGYTFGQPEKVAPVGGVSTYVKFDGGKTSLLSGEDFLYYAGYDIDSEASLLPSISYDSMAETKLPYYKMTFDSGSKKILSDSLGEFIITGHSEDASFTVINGTTSASLKKESPYILHYVSEDTETGEKNEITIECVRDKTNKAFILPSSTIKSAEIDLEALISDGTKFNIHPCLVVPIIHRPFYFEMYPIFLGEFNAFGSGSTSGDIFVPEETIKAAIADTSTKAIPLGPGCRDLTFRITRDKNATNKNLATIPYTIYGGNGINTKLPDGSIVCNLGDCTINGVPMKNIDIINSVVSSDINASVSGVTRITEIDQINDIFSDEITVRAETSVPSDGDLGSDPITKKDLTSFVDGDINKLSTKTEFTIENYLPKEIVIRRETASEDQKFGGAIEKKKEYLTIGDEETVDVKTVNKNVKLYMVILPSDKSNYKDKLGSSVAKLIKTHNSLLPKSISTYCTITPDTDRASFVGKGERTDTSYIISSISAEHYFSNPAAVAFMLDQLIDCTHFLTLDYGQYFRSPTGTGYQRPRIVYHGTYGGYIDLPFGRYPMDYEQTYNTALEKSVIYRERRSGDLNTGIAARWDGIRPNTRKCYDVDPRYKLDIASLLKQKNDMFDKDIDGKESVWSGTSVLDIAKSSDLSKAMENFGYELDVVVKYEDHGDADAAASSFDALKKLYYYYNKAYLGTPLDESGNPISNSSEITSAIEANEKYLEKDQFDSIILRNWSFPNIEFKTTAATIPDTAINVVDKFVKNLNDAKDNGIGYSKVIAETFLNYSATSTKKDDDNIMREIHDSFMANKIQGFVVPVALGEEDSSDTDSIKFGKIKIKDDKENVIGHIDLLNETCKGYSLIGGILTSVETKCGGLIAQDNQWTINFANKYILSPIAQQYSTVSLDDISSLTSVAEESKTMLGTLRNAIFDENLSLGFRSIIVGIYDGDEAMRDTENGTNNLIRPFKIYTYHHKGLSSYGNEGSKTVATHNFNDNFNPNAYNTKRDTGISLDETFPAYNYEKVINDYDNYASGWC